MNNTLANPFYYLENFRFVLEWVLLRYRDLLDQAEINFIEKFSRTPQASQALLVRMIMRKGDLFRVSKLNYEEIGETSSAAQWLIEQDWVGVDPCITVEQLYAVVTKQEFAQAMGVLARKTSSKAELLELAQHACLPPRSFSQWGTIPGDTLYELRVGDLCDRIRLMFFGNLYQDWSEFVLADLGIFTYEKVEFSETSRAFQRRHDIDTYLHLHACREALHNGAPLVEIERELDTVECGNPWLRGRKAKLLFHIGQEYERLNDWANAIQAYARCDYAGARARHVRVLEKDEQCAAALALAQSALDAPESDAEAQQLRRMLPRLERKLGIPREKAGIKLAIPQIDLVLPMPTDGLFVEEVARLHFEQSHEGSVVHYVENTLIQSLFGLLCWDAIFCAIPGAFFHPFQTGPADLHSIDFRTRRDAQFQHAFSQLASEQYKHTIREKFRDKAGIQSPMVAWGMLDEALLELALYCFPAPHLEKWFERILADIASNRTGFPDLIQFWPEEKRYRMLEIKGPGDRLQDNQIRFMEFCLQHEMPVAVCHVEWDSTTP